MKQAAGRKTVYLEEDWYNQPLCAIHTIEVRVARGSSPEGILSPFLWNSVMDDHLLCFLDHNGHNTGLCTMTSSFYLTQGKYYIQCSDRMYAASPESHNKIDHSGVAKHKPIKIDHSRINQVDQAGEIRTSKFSRWKDTSVGGDKISGCDTRLQNRYLYRMVVKPMKTYASMVFVTKDESSDRC